MQNAKNGQNVQKDIYTKVIFIFVYNMMEVWRMSICQNTNEIH